MGRSTFDVGQRAKLHPRYERAGEVRIPFGGSPLAKGEAGRSTATVHRLPHTKTTGINSTFTSLPGTTTGQTKRSSKCTRKYKRERSNNHKKTMVTKGDRVQRQREGRRRKKKQMRKPEHKLIHPIIIKCKFMVMSDK
ncbi:uncharacterized protein VTP21DRAFT_9275 [Calcarisporiella thermophila]|uniref:uncharacterized protein n=1 Tax=Calcarisporiella thermophila TaxID=911321 RepID=UPI003743747E